MTPWLRCTYTAPWLRRARVVASCSTWFALGLLLGAAIDITVRIYA